MLQRWVCTGRRSASWLGQGMDAFGKGQEANGKGRRASKCAHLLGHHAHVHQRTKTAQRNECGGMASSQEVGLRLATAWAPC